MNHFLRTIRTQLHPTRTATATLAVATTSYLTWRFYKHEEQFPKRFSQSVSTPLQEQLRRSSTTMVFSTLEQASHVVKEELLNTAEVKQEPQEQTSNTGAFDPETGEINWDCPCLGGMAHEEEPKGMDCIEKFKHMQDCFREHPDIYAEELAGDEDTPTDMEESTASNAIPQKRSTTSVEDGTLTPRGVPAALIDNSPPIPFYSLPRPSHSPSHR